MTTSEPGGFHRPISKFLRVPFLQQVEDACEQLSITLQWHSDCWVGVMTRRSQRRHIVGYTFALNDSAAVELAVDKAVTHSMLSHFGIPTVAHREFNFGRYDIAEATSAILNEVALPLVVKPLRGHSGVDVYRVQSGSDLASTLKVLRSRYPSVAVAPLVRDAEEYRVIVLDGQILLTFRKAHISDFRAADSEWRHNAEFGSQAIIVPATDTIHSTLTSLAALTMDALGLRCGAIDIFDAGTNLSVLEVNDAFSLNRFSLQSEENYRIAASIYSQAIFRCFE